MRSLPLLLLSLTLGACDLVGGGGPDIARYTGLAITDADATVVDEAGIPRRWVALVSQGLEVTLSRSVLCGDECTRTTELTFTGGVALPHSVVGTVTTRAYLPDQFEERRLAISHVEIQDWGPLVYSGVVYPVPQDEAFQVPLVFWTDDLRYETD